MSIIEGKQDPSLEGAKTQAAFGMYRQDLSEVMKQQSMVNMLPEIAKREQHIERLLEVIHRQAETIAMLTDRLAAQSEDQPEKGRRAL
jgi:hypothetical protein